MKMQAFKLQNLFLATAMIAMASCSDSVIEGIDPETNPLDDYVTDVKLNVEDFEYVGDGTRTSYDLNWDTYVGYTTFSWTKGDKVGVMPIREYGDPWPSTMVAYTIESKDDAKGAEATFDGRGWQLKNNVKYTALYPYSYTFNDPETMDYEFFQVSFQGQRQIGNNSRSHLGKYDFMAAAPVQSENGSLHFNFKHLATLCQFDIYAQEKRTFSKMVVSFSDNTTTYRIPLDAAIVNYQTTNPSLYTFNSQPAFEIALQDVTTGYDGYVHIFAMLPPEMFENENIRNIDVKLFDTYGYEIAFSNPNKQVKPAAGKYLNFTFNKSISGYEKNEAHIDGVTFNNTIKSKVSLDYVKNVVFQSGRRLDESFSIDLSASNETYKVKAKFDTTNGLLTIATNTSYISIKDCSNLFSNFKALESIDSLCVMNTSKTTTMASMFYGCKSLKTVSFAGIDTRSVENFSFMFYGCESLEEINLQSFNNFSATNFNSMFRGCTNLKDFLLGSNFVCNEKKDISLNRMFNGCENLNSLKGRFNTSSVTDMSYMFYNAKAQSSGGMYDIQSLIGGFDTSNVTDMSYMFAYLDMETLNINNFTTDRLLNVDHMFYATSLKDLSMNGGTFEKVTNFNEMLSSTYELRVLQIMNMNFDPSKASYNNMMSGLGLYYEKLIVGAVVHANIKMKDFFTNNITTSYAQFRWYQ